MYNTQRLCIISNKISNFVGRAAFKSLTYI